jgi:hypothetical protein
MKIPGKTRELTIMVVVRAVLTLAGLLALAWYWHARH